MRRKLSLKTLLGKRRVSGVKLGFLSFSMAGKKCDKELVRNQLIFQNGTVTIKLGDQDYAWTNYTVEVGYVCRTAA